MLCSTAPETLAWAELLARAQLCVLWTAGLHQSHTFTGPLQLGIIYITHSFLPLRQSHVCQANHCSSGTPCPKHPMQGNSALHKLSWFLIASKGKKWVSQMMHSPSCKSQTSLRQHSTVLGATLQQIPDWISIQKHLSLPTRSALLGFDMLSPLFTQPKLFWALTDSYRTQQNSRRAAWAPHSIPSCWSLEHKESPAPHPRPQHLQGKQPLPACCCCCLLVTANPPNQAVH